MGTIMIVLGPIASEDLGLTLPHEGVFIDLTAFPGSITKGGLLAVLDPMRHMDIMIRELEAFKAIGGKGVVELTCRNMGGNIRAHKQIASDTGLSMPLRLRISWVTVANIASTGDSGTAIGDYPPAQPCDGLPEGLPPSASSIGVVPATTCAP